jgi:glycosyltransferase involved in cell wall biosynthesis
MKIFYDHYAFTYLKFGGISKYMCELLKNIPKENYYNSTIISNNQHIQDSGLIKTIKFFPNLKFRGKERIMFELNMPYTKYKMHTVDWDVFHSTWFATRYFNELKGKRVVVTIHDLIYDVFYKDKDIPNKEKIIDMGRKSAERADKVIAVSQYTKQNMIDIWGIDGQKIEVIHHGVDKNRYSLSKMRLIKNPYLFFVGGSRVATKNFEHLIDAFSILTKRYKDLRLVCSGVKFTNQERQELQRLRIIDKVIHFYATDQQMAQLYYDAEMLVVPSYYEGFGMPILEAMVYDCPLALSNASCLPEIAAEAGVYYNPYDVEEMCDKISLLLEDTAFREKQKNLCRQRLNNFSWEKCATEHLKLYETLI